jgi:hypothetical protein
MLYIIPLLSFFSLVLLPFFIYGLYSHYESYKAEKEQEDFIKSLTPGSEWILQLEPKLNPFDKPSPTTIVTIVETRKNSYGDVWVQYKSKNTGYLRERRASHFKELYNKLN